ncbi:MAG: CNNM domain-containing protein [Candidatus Marsarchaeota archaeon]|nr:CNNM domain-containing protein [Candidatus Marsarchaeota archaeon]
MYIALVLGTVYVVLVCLSFVFSAAETSYSSLRLTLVRLMAAHGSAQANLVLRLVSRLPETLNAIIIGDNIVNLVFTSIATVAGYVFYGALGAVLFAFINLGVVFVVGEAWPKNLAVNNPEKVAMRLSRFMTHYLRVMGKPANLMTMVGSRLSSLAGLSQQRRSDPSTEERVINLMELAMVEGVITRTQHEFINKVLKIDDLLASDIMIPYELCVKVDATTRIRDAMAVFGQAGHRRLPVVEYSQRQVKAADPASVKGAISIRDAAIAYINGYSDSVVTEVCEPIALVKADNNLVVTLREMQAIKAQVCAVVSDSNVVGFVFLNDLLEEILGETFSPPLSRRDKHLKHDAVGGVANPA